MYQCPHCPAEPPYASASGLWYHMKRHHGAVTRPYKNSLLLKPAEKRRRKNNSAATTTITTTTSSTSTMFFGTTNTSAMFARFNTSSSSAPIDQATKFRPALQASIGQPIPVNTTTGILGTTAATATNNDKKSNTSDEDEYDYEGL